jgi:Peptidase family M28
VRGDGDAAATVKFRGRLLAILNGRIYRAAMVVVLVALAIAALSLANRPAPLGSTLAPDAFDGAWTMQELQTLSREFPDRAPGSSGDARLARRFAAVLDGLGGAAGGGFHVKQWRASAQTVNGERTLTTVVGERPGTTNESPIVLVAHRDASAPGSRAALSGTAVLMELARVLANEQTNRTVLLVSTSGGSGGDGGAADLASLVQSGRVPWTPTPEASTGRSVDAAIVLGDVASANLRAPLVIPYSSGLGSAPVQLSETAASAMSGQLGVRAGAPGLADQLAHLAVPLTAGEQGPLDAIGLPAVLVQASGERGPTERSPISEGRLEGFGSAVLSTVGALDGAPDVQAAPQAGLVLSHNVVPGWAARLLVGALLVPALLVVVDALARARRRREAVGRWVLFTLACALPFLACALLVALAGVLGIAPATGEPVPASAVHATTAAWSTLVLALLALFAAVIALPRLVRALGVPRGPLPAAGGLAFMLVLDAIAVITWVVNPFAALLMVPAAHVWLLVAAPELRPSRGWVGMGIVLLGVCAPALVALYYANQFGGGPGSLWTLMLLVAGGHIGPGTLVLWSVSLGCVALATFAALSGRRAPNPREAPAAITIRGPVSYAGPGSLGGTESALRR